ncbi:MAG: penicillin acylase family protein [Planctomycetes bacterium]|nr:penicillin acylase family protein [Planctomycetota bacterium]
MKDATRDRSERGTVGRNPAVGQPVVLMIVLSSSLLSAAGEARGGSVEILRDRWGIPHIFAETDADAFYGLGYATAEDRGFQMYYTLRVIQGRVSELIGNVRKVRGRGTSVDNDRRMRTFGFYRAAQRVAKNLDADTLRLLQAYCDGVNAYFRKHKSGRHYLFERLGLEPEPWTPADCIVSWWHLAQFFGPDGTRDLVASRMQAGGRGAARGRGRAETGPDRKRAQAGTGRETARDRGRGRGRLRPQTAPSPAAWR